MKSKTVTIDVQGGIGNQLFMYFAALYWAEVNNAKLIVNVGKIGAFGVHHGSALDEFELNCEVINRKLTHLGGLLYRVRRRFLKTKLGLKLDELFQFRFYYSAEVGYDEKLEARKHLKSIEGYFQTYKYFDALSDPNLKFLRLTNVSSWFEKTRLAIQQLQFLAVHVRRGDFKNFSKNVGILSKDYYAAAIGKIDRTFRNELPIIVFSDEPELAKMVLIEYENRVVEWITQPPDSSPIESLLLMSDAHAIVIANSTYSWWAAKLGRPELVIAPKQWFRMGKPPKNLYPPDWHLVPSSWEN